MRYLIAMLLTLFPAITTAASSSAAGNGPLLPLESIAKQCVALTEIKFGAQDWEVAECAVSLSGSIGVVDGRTYHYALYCLLPNYDRKSGGCGGNRYHWFRGVAVFVQEGRDKARLLFERASSEIGMYVYEKPRIVRNSSGTLLVLTIGMEGTGAGNASEYYLLTNGEWRQIEAEAWIEDVRKKLPAGLELWKGLWPDLETMTAKAGLYQKGDANCCPTGGEAVITLAIENSRFVVRSVRVERGEGR